MLRWPARGRSFRKPVDTAGEIVQGQGQPPELGLKLLAHGLRDLWGDRNADQLLWRDDTIHVDLVSAQHHPVGLQRLRPNDRHRPVNKATDRVWRSGQVQRGVVTEFVQEYEAVIWPRTPGHLQAQIRDHPALWGQCWRYKSVPQHRYQAIDPNGLGTARVAREDMEQRTYLPGAGEPVR